MQLEGLVSSNHLEDANKVFLKGAKGGLRATDELYDHLIEEDCKVGDHSNALTIAYEMEAAGRMATTFHFNCLLSCQVINGVPLSSMLVGVLFFWCWRNQLLHFVHLFTLAQHIYLYDTVLHLADFSNNLN